MRRLNEEPIPAEGRLLRSVRHRHIERLMTEIAVRAALEAGFDVPTQEEIRAATAAGEEEKLRGLPMVADGVGGVQPHTRPSSEASWRRVRGIATVLPVRCITRRLP